MDLRIWVRFRASSRIRILVDSVHVVGAFQDEMRVFCKRQELERGPELGLEVELGGLKVWVSNDFVQADCSTAVTCAGGRGRIWVGASVGLENLGKV